jgi:uncharacterized iron-regulated protein
MRNTLRWAPALLLAACGGTAPAAAPVAPAAALALPESTVVLDAATGAPIASAELLRRARAADFVLLGEIHDNIAHHQVRGALLTAAGRHPAVVFEQFARSAGPIPPPAGGTADDAWLDQYGFDRKNWRWPLHQPVVQAALASGQGVWGSGLPRETLRAVVRGGAAAAPPELRAIIEQAPLDSVARAAIDRELFEGHCGKLPAEMVPGMRAAQELRDASMAEALLTAAKGGGAGLADRRRRPRARRHGGAADAASRGARQDPADRGRGGAGHRGGGAGAGGGAPVPGADRHPARGARRPLRQPVSGGYPVTQPPPARARPRPRAVAGGDGAPGPDAAGAGPSWWCRSCATSRWARPPRTGMLAWLLVGLALYWLYAGLGSRPLLLLQLVIFSVAAALLTTKAGLVIVGIDRLSILRRTAKTLIMVGAGLAGLNLGALLLASLKRREPPAGGPRQA